VDNSLRFTVTAPMPVLDVVFHSFPDSLMFGEVLQTVLEINNKGNRGMKHLKLKTSHPSFFSVGAPILLDSPIYGKIKNKNGKVYFIYNFDR